VIHNVAPRRDQPGPRPTNEGERFCAGRTDDGVLVVGPNSGFSFSFCATELQAARCLALPAGARSSGRAICTPGRSRRRSPATRTRSARTCQHSAPRAASLGDRLRGRLRQSEDHGEDAPAPAGARMLVRTGEVSATATVGDGTSVVARANWRLRPDPPAGARVRAASARSSSCSCEVAKRRSDSPSRPRGLRCGSSELIAGRTSESDLVPAARRSRPPGRSLQASGPRPITSRRTRGPALGPARVARARVEAESAAASRSSTRVRDYPAARPLAARGCRRAAARHNSTSGPCSPCTGSWAGTGTRAMLARTSSRSAGSPRRMSQRIPFG
jgi:hypothetical protein